MISVLGYITHSCCTLVIQSADFMCRQQENGGVIYNFRGVRIWTLLFIFFAPKDTSLMAKWKVHPAQKELHYAANTRLAFCKQTAQRWQRTRSDVKPECMSIQPSAGNKAGDEPSWLHCSSASNRSCSYSRAAVVIALKFLQPDFKPCVVLLALCSNVHAEGTIACIRAGICESVWRDAASGLYL